MPKFLHEIPLFAGLSEDELELVEQVGQAERYSVGYVIFDEHSPGEAMYVIQRGQVDIQMTPPHGSDATDEPRTIASLEAGDVFGEVALVDQGLRTARALCAKPTLLLVFGRKDVLRLAQDHPHIGYVLMRNVAEALAFKLRSTDLTLGYALALERQVEEY
ncbi:MAG: cyclic nucleotide-binding domain-containing protein [Chloroflexi bacterium]|nr:cyclic nucleotide-binding domain-containing protein [Chloroflexota bacterium]MBU1749898.1 cyclic nucleotide-binding domain-containing protein [Chloroflexota bacterium]MBU1879644.1 cyclic nucleotide-binding domain-containing protein [Chloroflexota bacterium]